MAVFNLASVFPGHLNIEADQSNLLVLRHWLASLGHGVNLHAITNDEQFSRLASFDFVLVGHGVPSAWMQIESLQPKLQSLIRAAIDANVSGLLVASGWDRQAESRGQVLATGERKSLFATGTIEPGSHDRVFGYVNSTTKSRVIAVDNDFLLTQLHGPLFAKNSWLTLAVVNRMLEKRGLQQFQDISHYENLKKIRELEIQAIAANEYSDEPLL